MHDLTLYHALTDFQDIARRAREAEDFLQFGEALIAIQEIAEQGSFAGEGEILR
ncbi:hypothetical protein HF680_15385 [Brevundimonas sp. WCHBH090558]|uniref:hypothetical protein n=1 Tax=Brevundimonas huaxiensis TaxID=2725493 RepID=UPI00162A9569|nr:hypothetical protein [Brevundimonas huaxiensis]MBC1184023.1 hypothetical protein [Brevundimonas huaxiensis]